MNYTASGYARCADNDNSRRIWAVFTITYSKTTMKIVFFDYAAVFDILTKYNVDVHKINLEITETAIALSEDKLLSNLQKLTKNNLKISLDDFGSGYSNFKRLSQLPVSIVKIDKSITDEINDPRFSLIFKKLNEIIKELNLKVIVEGVEDKDTLDYFTECKSDFIQGYYFSKPLSKKDYIEFLTNLS